MTMDTSKSISSSLPSSPKQQASASKRKHSLSHALSRLDMSLSTPNITDTASSCDDQLNFASKDIAQILGSKESIDDGSGLRDVDARKRNQAFHDLFPNVGVDEVLIEDVACALQKDILVQGRLYITEWNLHFYAKIFSWVHTASIPFSEIVSIDNRNVAGIIPNSIEINTNDSTYFFASFMQRDVTVEMIRKLWLNPNKSQPVKLKTFKRMSAVTQGVVDNKKEEGEEETVLISSEAESKYDDLAFMDARENSMDGETVEPIEPPPPMEKSSSIDSSSIISSSSLQGNSTSFMKSLKKLWPTNNKVAGSSSTSSSSDDERLSQSSSHNKLGHKRAPRSKSLNRHSKKAPTTSISQANKVAAIISKCEDNENSSVMLNRLLNSPDRKLSGLNDLTAERLGDDIIQQEKIVKLPSDLDTSSPTKKKLIGKKRKIHECGCNFPKMTLISDFESNLTVSEIWDVVYSNKFLYDDGEGKCFKKFLEDNRKQRDIEATKWTDVNTGQEATGINVGNWRKINCIALLSNPFGPKQTTMVNREEIINYCQNELNPSKSPHFICIGSSVQTPDVPSGNSFFSNSRICLTEIGSSQTRVKVHGEIEWVKSSWLKAAIERAVIDGMKNHFIELDKFLKDNIIPKNVPDDDELPGLEKNQEKPMESIGTHLNGTRHKDVSLKEVEDAFNVILQYFHLSKKSALVLIVVVLLLISNGLVQLIL